MKKAAYKESRKAQRGAKTRAVAPEKTVTITIPASVAHALEVLADVEGVTVEQWLRDNASMNASATLDEVGAFPAAERRVAHAILCMENTVKGDTRNMDRCAEILAVN